MMFSESVDYLKGETPMTDYQFQQYITLRDKCEILENKNKALEDKNDALYQLVKTYAKEGKSPQEILVAVEVLRERDIFNPTHFHRVY